MLRPSIGCDQLAFYHLSRLMHHCGRDVATNGGAQNTVPGFPSGLFGCASDAHHPSHRANEELWRLRGKPGRYLSPCTNPCRYSPATARAFRHIIASIKRLSPTFPHISILRLAQLLGVLCVIWARHIRFRAQSFFSVICYPTARRIR